MSRTRFFHIGISLMFLAVPSVSRAEFPGGLGYFLQEQQRRSAIAAQIGLQECLREQMGLPSRLPGGPTYDSCLADWPPSLLGRTWDFGTPQPWGHRVTPQGPNGYVFEPVYHPIPGKRWDDLPPNTKLGDQGVVHPPAPQAEELPLPPPVSHSDTREF